MCIYCTYCLMEARCLVCDWQDWLHNTVYASWWLEGHAAASGVDIGQYEFKVYFPWLTFAFWELCCPSDSMAQMSVGNGGGMWMWSWQVNFETDVQWRKNEAFLHICFFLEWVYKLIWSSFCHIFMIFFLYLYLYIVLQFLWSLGRSLII